MFNISNPFLFSFAFFIFLNNSSCANLGSDFLYKMQSNLLKYDIALFQEEQSILKDTYKVTKVIDGDTFWVIDSSKTEMKVRLIGIDAPESRNVFRKKKEYYGIESKQYLTKLIADQNIKLEFDVDSLDQYGRTLAYAYLMEGEFLNEKLVKTGNATILTITPNVKYEAKFIEAQRYARENQIGLWQE